MLCVKFLLGGVSLNNGKILNKSELTLSNYVIVLLNIVGENKGGGQSPAFPVCSI